MATVNYDIEGILSGMKGKKQGEYTLILCPFHADGNPSCSVKTKPPYQGFYKCWSCGAKGPFSKLAEKLGIEAGCEATPPIQVEAYEAFFSENSSTEAADVVLITHDQLKPLSAKNVEAMGIKDGWRGVPIDFLRETIGAKIIDRYSLYFPVMVNDKEVGYIRAFKEKKKGRPSYLNKPGPWTKTQGLFLFDQAMELARESKTLILVEGPRDPIGIMLEGMPAVAMLGTNSWSDAKRRLIERAGVENLILCMDGDEAGHKASLALKEACLGYLHVVDFKLYEWEGEYDPFNMPKTLMRRLRKVYENTVSSGRTHIS